MQFHSFCFVAVEVDVFRFVNLCVLCRRQTACVRPYDNLFCCNNSCLSLGTCSVEEQRPAAKVFDSIHQESEMHSTTASNVRLAAVALHMQLLQCTGVAR